MFPNSPELPAGDDQAEEGSRGQHRQLSRSQRYQQTGEWTSTAYIKRHVEKTDFSNWRHSVEQVYLGYNHNKSEHRLRITCPISRGGREEREMYSIHLRTAVLEKIFF